MSSERKRRKVVNGDSPGPSPQASSFPSQPRSQLWRREADLEPYAGVIKSLTLTNFMCHSNFTHDFHSNLNFITGQNGSGKSALLSGILIALGGKATVTSRTTSVKSLVQKGKSTCRVSVTLLNKRGLRRYGDEISIERWLNVGGSGGYRIKSTGGDDPDRCFNWRPLKRPELNSILLGLNIQIDNPVAILNQEVARSFLRSKDPKVKFNLFYDGTLLSKVEVIIAETKKEVAEIKVLIDHQVEIMRTVKQEFLHYQQKYEKIAELDQVKEKLISVKNEYLWALVTEQEKLVGETEKLIQTDLKDIDLLTTKIEEIKSNLANANEANILREQGKLKSRIAEKQQEIGQNRQQLVEVKKSFVTLKNKLKTLVSSIEAKERQISKLSSSLEKVKAEEAARSRVETDQEAEALAAMQDEKKELEALVASIRSDAENFQLSADSEREKSHQLENESRAIRAQAEQKRRLLAAISGRKINKYAAFGPKMEQLVFKIQSNLHKFRKPPRGPLGTCFRVKDPAYAPVMEGALFTHLDSFVVGDAQDLTLLKEFVSSIYSERPTQSQQKGYQSRTRIPGIHYMKYTDELYDVSHHHSSLPNAPSFLDLIEIENNDPIVYNAIIDVMEVERMVIFKDVPSAAAVLKNPSRVPKGLKLGWTLGFYKLTPVPRYGAKFIPRRDRAEILKSGRSKEIEIGILKDEIQALEQQVKGLEPQKNEIKKTEQSYRDRYEQKSKEVDRVRRKLGEVINSIKRHAARIKDKEKNSDFSSYYEELEELRESCDKHIKERDDTSKLLEPLQPQWDELDNQRKKLDASITDLNNEMNSLVESRDKLTTKRMEYEAIIKKLESRLTTIKESMKKLEQERERKDNERKEKLKQAQKMCPKRIPTKRSSEDAMKQYEMMKVRITETESRLGDKATILVQRNEKKKKYQTIKEQLAPFSRMWSLIEQTNIQQETTFLNMRAHMGRTLSFFFSTMAQLRKYEGRLLVEFDTKELYYFVCPDGDSSLKTLQTIDAQEKKDGPRNGAPRHSKAFKKALVEYSLGLSGGERSFATICYIMSLWQVMECPFYMLDEFDVFMDAFNRKISQKALITHAKRFIQNQFLLFTPLELDDLPEKKDADVLRLFPPKRAGLGTGSRTQEPNGENDASHANGETLSQPVASSSRGRRKAAVETSPNENVDPLQEPETTGRGKGRKRNADGGTPRKGAGDSSSVRGVIHEY